MKRNHIYALLLTLLIMLPIGLSAQSVTGMQYWFDNGSKHTTSISEGSNTKSISTDGLSVGMHTLYYRFTQSGGDITWEGDITDVETGEVTHESIYYTDLDYSPVYSTRFFKHDESQGSTVEYWFDNKSSSYHATTSLSGAEGETVSLDLTDISKFPLGFHQLNMRFSTPGKSPSAIYTADVMKFSAGSRYLQYWVDDNYSPESPKVEGTVMTAHLDDGKTRDDVVFSMTQLPLTDVEPGLHHLYYRTCDANGVAGSAVYSAIIFRHASEANQIEYWFDNDASTIQRKEFAEAYQNGATYSLDLTSDVFPQGLHQLNIRVSTKNGSKSAIYSTPVVKMSANSFKTVEFWLDDDREHIKTLSGSLSSNGVAIVGDLDFSDAAPGMHYLHYRAVGTDGKPSNAVGEWPIMVKSRYNVENTETLTVKEQAYWFDNEEPQVTPVASPRSIVNLPYTFDVRRLSDGNHTLHLQYANSAGIWNAPVNLSFTKLKVNPPVITASATVEEGVVTLRFSSVAHGKRYVVYRRYASGTEVKVDDIKNFDYPEDVQAIDTPVPGTYTYYVDALYADADGVTQRIRSEEVNVTIGQAASTIPKGTVYALLRIDGKSITNPSFHQYTVKVNGQSVTQAGYTLNKQNFGQFKIDGIPYGTELAISVESERYNFKGISLIVSENTSKGSYYIDGSEIDDEDFQPDNNSYDLVISQKVHLTPTAFELRVWNGQNGKWSGNIIMKIISKEVKDMYDKYQSEGGLSLWYYLLHPNAGLDNGLVYTNAVDMHVNIDGKESKTLVLDILDLPQGNKAEDYYVYVYSKRDGTDELKELGDNDISSNRNPQTLNFNPSDYSLTGDNDDKTFIEDYKTIMRHLKMMAKWGDPFALEINTFGKDFNDIVNNLGNHTIDYDGFAKDMIVNTSQSAGMFMSLFLSDIQKQIKQTSKSIKNSLKVADGIVKVYDRLVDFYEVQNNKVDENKKYFELSKIVLKVCKDIKAENLSVSMFPALGIYQRYLEVGAAMAGNIERLSNTVNAHYVWDKLYHGKGIYKIRIRKYSDKNEYFEGRDFFPHKGRYNSFVTHSGQIKSIKIDLIDPAVEGNNLSVLVKNEWVTLENDGLTIENVEFPQNKHYSTGGEAWMTITWKNNRVTHVPLLDKNFVKHENFDSADENKPLIMTVDLQSGTYMHEESIPNELTFIQQR